MTEAEASVVACDPARRAEGLAAARHAITFLRTCEARDLEKAHTMVAPGFAARFPRGRHYDSLASWQAASKLTFTSMRKRFARIDVALTGADTAIVYCYGSLHGAFVDGRVVDGDRFIDRFEIKAGLITEQDVWNDLV